MYVTSCNRHVDRSTVTANRQRTLTTSRTSDILKTNTKHHNKANLLDCIIHTHTHAHPFNGLFSRTTRVSRYQKVKPIWILLKQETVSGSGISWAICKSASRSRQITMPVPHHSSFLQAGCPSCRPTNSVKALKVHYI